MIPHKDRMVTAVEDAKIHSFDLNLASVFLPCYDSVIDSDSDMEQNHDTSSFAIYLAAAANETPFHPPFKSWL